MKHETTSVHQRRPDLRVRDDEPQASQSSRGGFRSVMSLDGESSALDDPKLQAIFGSSAEYQSRMLSRRHSFGLVA